MHRQLLSLTLLTCGVLAGCASREAASHAAAEAPPKLDAPHVRAEARRLIEKHRVASIGFASVRDGQLVTSGAVGTQSPGVEANEATLYNVASLTKPVTAEAVLRLASQGVLSLDEPMSTAWIDPDLRDDPRHAKLTPRLALSHRCGFPNWRRQTSDHLKFIAEPGSTFGYSGEGFEYVARFAAKRANEPFEPLVERLVFRPIGMNNSALTGRPWFTGHVAAAYDKEGRVIPVAVPTEYCAADDLHTTAKDYATFAIEVMRGRAVTPELRREQARIQIQTSEAADSKTGKPVRSGPGLGWFVYEIGGETYLMHTGKDQGCFTIAVLHPATGDAQVVLTNSDQGADVVLDMLKALGADDDFVRILRDSR